MIELIAEKYFPDSKAKSEIRRIVVYWTRNDVVSELFTILHDHVDEIKEQLQIDFAKDTARFSKLDRQIYHLFYCAEQYKEFGKMADISIN